MAREEGLRGYGNLRKPELIDTILYHRRAVKPQVDMLSQLKKEELKRLAREEGLTTIGNKSRIAQNITHHQVYRKNRPLLDVLEDVINDELKPH